MILPQLDHANNQKPKYGWCKASNFEGLKMSEFSWFCLIQRRNRLEELCESLRSTRMHYTTIDAPRGVKILDEALHQPYFGFCLFAWSRCGRIIKKSSREDSWYQDYSVLLTSPSPSCHQVPSPFVTETARNIWANNIYCCERSIYQTTEVLLVLRF